MKMKNSIITIILWGTLVLMIASITACSPEQSNNESTTAEEPFIQYQSYYVNSGIMGAFWGETVRIEMWVLLPHDYQKGQAYPVVYDIKDGDVSIYMAGAFAPVNEMKDQMKNGDYPKMIYVYLECIHQELSHMYVDSEILGPWNRALIKEIIPAIEAEYAPGTTAKKRFLVGFEQSAGWTALWLQLNHPDFFNGVWSVEPMYVDFRHFSTVNLYEDGNAYVDENGVDRQHFNYGEYHSSDTIREWAEFQKDFEDLGGLGVSFLNSCLSVFSRPNGNKKPKPLFDWETGDIFDDTVNDWQRYDLAKLIQKKWPAIGDKLKGKITLYNTNSMPGVLSFQEVLEQLGSDAVFYNRQRNKNALVEEIHREIWAKYQN